MENSGQSYQFFSDIFIIFGEEFTTVSPKECVSEKCFFIYIMFIHTKKRKYNADTSHLGEMLT
jgi:hypothetical protein